MKQIELSLILFKMYIILHALLYSQHAQYTFNIEK